MKSKIKLRYLALLVTCSTILSCAQPRARMYDGPDLMPDQLSIIRTDDKKVSIVSIDGKKSVGFIEYMLHNSQWAGEISLKPGEHELYIRYDDSQRHSLYLIKLITLPGHTYLIKNLTYARSARLWLEDSDSKQHIGKITASTNEPIDEETLIDHSVYYTFSPPRDEGWTIAYRNSTQTALAKEGSNLDETYAISIFVSELPNFASEEEFIDFLKKEKDKDTDSKRFKILKNDPQIYKGRGDYCVNYHSIVEDHMAAKKSSNKDPMFLETVDYICRHPKNKNIGIIFDYSHRYYSGHSDEQLTEDASTVFKQLDF